MTKVIGFVKVSGVWYAELNEIGENLTVTDSAGSFLDFISENGIRVDILFSSDRFGGCDGTIQKEVAENDGKEDVVFYTIDNYNSSEYKHKFGFNTFVGQAFGGQLPDVLFLKVLNVKSSRKSKTIYHLIVDRSGSMSDCRAQTLKGLNEQIENVKNLQQQYPDQEITIGLTFFNNEVSELFSMANPSKIMGLTKKDYITNGSTSLLDAIGFTIEKIEPIQTQSNVKLPTNVVIVIITDGEENSSTNFSLEAIKSTIIRLQGTERWMFSFIGADIDAIAVATNMGINRKNSFNFNKRAMNVEVFDKLSHGMSLHMLHYDSNPFETRKDFFED